MQIRSRDKSRKTKPQAYIAKVSIGVGLMLIGIAAILNFPLLSSLIDSFDIPGEFNSVPAPNEVNFSAPKIRLTTLQGESVSLQDFRGTTVLVNNWAVWCPPCKAEMPTLQTYYNTHKNQNFTIIAIEAGSSLAVVDKYVSENNLTLPIWLDPTEKATVAFNNPALPSSYLIDSTGTVRHMWTGSINIDILEKYVSPYLEE